MKKLQSKSGMTLLEMIVSLMILVLLVTAMGTGMDAAGKLFRDSIFESHSASLAGIVNTALGDVLRYAEDIRVPEEKDAAGNPVDEAVGFVFTNAAYGLHDVYFQTKTGADETAGILTLRSLRFEAESHNILEMALVNDGAYPDLEITNFKATYVEPGSEEKRGGYFYITYTIRASGNPAKTRDVETIVRLLRG